MAYVLALIEGMAIFVVISLEVWIGTWPFSDNWNGAAPVLIKGAVLALFFVIVLYYNDLYNLRAVPNWTRFVSRLPRVALMIAFLHAVFLIISRSSFISTDSFLPVVRTPLFIAGILLPFRAACYRILSDRRRIKRLLILGATPLAGKLIEEIQSHPDCGYSFLGLVDDAPASGDPYLHDSWLGPLQQFGRILEEARPDRVIVTLPAYSQLPVRDLLEARLHGVVVEDGVKVYERLAGKLAIESLMPNNLIFQKDFRKSEILLVFRRAFSLIAAAFGLVLALPLMGVIALLIKLDSAGPVLFIQERVGLMGRNFLLLKFRTMRPVNGKTSEWVRDNGNRITRVGKWLRKFRLDELPQLVNVLLGDMDLVGPRPHPVSNFRLFVVVLRNAPDCGIAIPYYSLRSAVRPGITGWAQIRYGYANDLEEEIEKIRYDLYYIKHMSLWFDLRIIFDTVKIALLGRGSESPHAYRAESAVESEA